MRLDQLLVERGLFDSRARAQAAIQAGLVVVNGKVVNKAAAKTHIDAEIEARDLHDYVSRGALKLAHGLNHFGVDPAGMTVLDVGASTGGFTEVLLRRHAARVICVDVGRDQLHPKIASDHRVTNWQAQDFRTLDADALQGPVDLVVCDVSFISVMKVLHHLSRFFGGQGALLALFKPQFEVGKAAIGKGGLVRDEAAVTAAQTALENWVHQEGARFGGWADSPIAGGDGNREYLFHAIWQ